MHGKENIEEALKGMFQSLLESENRKVNKNYGEMINKLINSGYDIEELDTFNVMVSYQIEQILEMVVANLCKNIDAGNNEYKLKFIYLKYSYLSNNIEKLISLREGGCCCSDKTRHILEEYKEYLVTGNIPEVNNERHFWIPNFGTYNNWFELLDSLIALYYGSPTNYIYAYKNLLESELRNIVKNK
ncbi:MAG: hypothetical protein K0R54_788 [Clostridiaceae bacterium]|jgi:hypothetical protein|nr:hypothetical protein [Clostridiaceae bacterium]